MTVRLFEDANALDSLRNSDFDAVSAYGEVIDNSIEADAKNIYVLFRADRDDPEHIACVAFGDDGKGMDADTLHQCLKIGWSSRFNQRGGIGRFGVGMTMAAIHECKRIEVFSKEKGGDWLSTHIDLDEVARGGMDSIPAPATARLPAEYENLVGSDSGTLVIWSKYDRQSENLTKLKEDTIIWAGRTYRYFIWDDGVRINVDGNEVPVIDPLYARTEMTRFPDDPKAKLFEDIVFPWPVDASDAPEHAPREAPVRIRMSILPEEFRREQGSGGKQVARERFIPMNEGISILRNRREVFYGPIPYWKFTADDARGWPFFEEKDRWWGCEIQFDAVLDRAFTVKNIKRGADPVRRLKLAIKQQIQPTRQTVMEEIDRVWKASRQARRESELETITLSGIERPTDHLEAEEVARKTPTDVSEIDRGKVLEEEAQQVIDRAKQHASDEERAAYVALFASQPFTIMEQHWRGSEFFESTHMGGSSVLEFNLDHPFFERVYGLIDSLTTGGDPYEVSRGLKALLDLLLIAYAKSEAKFAPETQMSAEQFIESVRANWGQYLKSYVRTWDREQPDA